MLPGREPGRELDAEIATKVMGFKAADASVERCWTLDAEFELPPYSTNILAAWDVAEHASLFNQHDLMLRQLNDNCWAMGERDYDYGWETFAEGTTAPHVLCLAALKSLGIS